MTEPGQLQPRVHASRHFTAIVSTPSLAPWQRIRPINLPRATTAQSVAPHPRHHWQRFVGQQRGAPPPRSLLGLRRHRWCAARRGLKRTIRGDDTPVGVTVDSKQIATDFNARPRAERQAVHHRQMARTFPGRRPCALYRSPDAFGRLACCRTGRWTVEPGQRPTAVELRAEAVFLRRPARSRALRLLATRALAGELTHKARGPNSTAVGQRPGRYR